MMKTASRNHLLESVKLRTILRVGLFGEKVAEWGRRREVSGTAIAFNVYRFLCLHLLACMYLLRVCASVCQCACECVTLKPADCARDRMEVSVYLKEYSV